jgi:predicted nucleic acid-binding protein
MTLTDTGPLVALLDKDDSRHAASLTAAKQLPSAPLWRRETSMGYNV